MILKGYKAMARRLGLKAMRAAAYRFCSLWLTYNSSIIALFTVSAPVVVAAEAVNVACAVFVGAVDAITEDGV